jgi:single-strand DNA-binding protein
MYGRISANVFRNSDGEAKAGLQFHTSAFKVIAGMAKKNQPAKEEHVQTVSEREGDDLPF